MVMPWRSANVVSRSAALVSSRSTGTSAMTARPGPAPSAHRSSSSLTIWTRWPVSTSILATRSRTLGGTSTRSRSAASSSVSSRTVESGVRSSCDRLSMNSARMRWSRRSSVTSSSADPRAAVAVGTSAHGEVAVAADRQLERSDRSSDGRTDHRLRAMVDEGLHHRPSQQGAGTPLEEPMRGAVRGANRQVRADVDDAERTPRR